MRKHCLLFFLLISTTVAQAQVASISVHLKDTADTIDKRLAELLSRPLVTEMDTLLEHLQLVLAYEKWTSLKRASDFMPLTEWVDTYTRKAQSQLLMGVFKTYALAKYIPIESGVLNLIENSIAHFDSAQVNYGRLMPYIVDRSVHSHQADSAFARALSDTLKVYLNTIMKQRHFGSLEGVDVIRLLDKLAYKSIYLDKKQPGKQSIAYWLNQAGAK